MKACTFSVFLFGLQSVGLAVEVKAHNVGVGTKDAAGLQLKLKRVLAEASRLVAKEAAAARNLSAPPPMKVVEHQKVAGNGYMQGSPLYEKQQELKNGTTVASGEVPPVSTTMRCIINLTVQFVIVYTALFIVQTMNKYSSDEKPLTHVERILEGTKETVQFVPMLAVLFLTVRMRAVQLSQGETEKYDLPQSWVKDSMIVCSWSVLAQTIFAVAYSLATRVPYEADGLHSSQSKQGPVAIGLGVCHYIIMLGIYVGFTICCVGLFVMEGPEEIWHGDVPKTSPAAKCVMTLTLLYFAAHLALVIARTANDLRTTTLRFGLGIDTLQLAADTVAFAPMLSILILAARLRALSIDPKHGAPQAWAQYAFYVATYAIVLQTILVLLAFFTGVPAKKDEFNEVIYEEKASTVGKVLEGIRMFAMAVMLISIIMVVVSIATIEHPDGAAKTPKVSPAVSCVIFQASYYFLIHAAIWICLTIRKRTGKLAEFAEYFRGPARESVDFCPILCVLFVGTRLRALQITNNTGAPQGWAQQCMYIASWAVLFQALARIDVLLERLMGKPLPKAARIACTTVQFLSLLFMYSAAVAIVVALFYITPQNATGAGALIPGVDIAPPPSR